MKTDAEGRYEGYGRGPQDAGLVTVTNLPQNYAPPLFVMSNTRFPEDAEEHQIPPIELAPAGEVHGIVVNAAGEPVAGANVEASWMVDEGPNRRMETKGIVRSGLDGRFTMTDVILGTKVAVVAHHLGLRTPRPVETAAGAKEPVRLQIDDSRAAAMDGRVVDSNEKPIAGAHVHLRRPTQFGGRDNSTVIKDACVDFEGVVVLLTDADGRFHTPRQLDREGLYSAYASKPGRITSHTEWTQARVERFPTIVLEPEEGTE